MDASELLVRYAAGERDFRGSNFSKAELSGTDLREINLSAANLSDAKLYNANLSEANLNFANLNGTKLNSANLSASLSGANLCCADLSGANLCCADLSGANLGGADLSGANLSDAGLNDANLSDADLSGANLYSAGLSDADLSGANLSGANLCCADLSGANLRGADLSDANLTTADLTDTNLNGAKIDETILAYQKLLEESQRENQEFAKRIKLLESQSEQLQQHSTQNLLKASNQGINAPHEWKGFYFRSQTEIKISEALDKAGVLFYPNCKARLNTPKGRDGKETDFLVFYQGKWGILEVDGEPWHPPSRTVHDHERDRLFKGHGIRIVEHYDATRCWNEADKVVQEFLEILSKA
jgi:uncharacterized protein YjbI with pentapeptide repeats